MPPSPERAALLSLDDGWELASTEPGAEPEAWAPVTLPAAGDDERDHWFRVRFRAEPAAPAEEVVLELGGIATVSEGWLDGARVIESASMYAPHAIDVTGAIGGEHELVIRCRALGPLLRERRRPRARWRTRIADNGLRWFRTTLFGRAPGFAPGPPVVGPWRPVRLVRRRGVAVDAVRLRPSLDGDEGVLHVHARVRALGAEALPAPLVVELDGPSGTHRAELAGDDGGDGCATTLRVPGVARWWPHTHGEPVLHDVRLVAGDVELWSGRTGFRDVDGGAAPEEHGLALRVNGVPVFARGAVWTPVPAGELRATLTAARDAGLNMVRIPGTAPYEDAPFFDLCDELGILVWQDLAFANFDYPIADAGFRALVEDEAGTVLDAIAGRPSLAVLCGGSEIEQQAAMLGLDPALGRGELFGELLPRVAAAAAPGVPYLPSSPCGGDLPFHPGRGVAHYFGVGAYRRPLEDARRAGVRFAGECLAFAHVPDDDALALTGVPRDAGADWDFADVRDHYLALLFGVDPAALRRDAPERYAELSRAVTGEVLAATLGEWRRDASPCGGALVLWLRDLVPGAGWGLLDHRGAPKAVLHHVRRACAPLAVWFVDEGLGGLDVHVANDLAEPLAGRLRVTLLGGGGERVVEELEQPVELAAHGALRVGVEALAGRFLDASYAYRFGPPAHDAVVATLEVGGAVAGEAFHFPAGRPLEPRRAEELGLEAELVTPLTLRLTTRALAYAVRIHAPGFAPADDAFSLAPGTPRDVALRPLSPDAVFDGATITALNLAGAIRAGAIRAAAPSG